MKTVIINTKIKAEQGIPFEMTIPNEETLTAMKEAKTNRHLETVTIEQYSIDALPIVSTSYLRTIP